MDHKPGYIAAIIVAILLCLATVYIQLSAVGIVNTPGIFHNSGNVTARFRMEMGVGVWLLWLWAVLYLWQIVWLVYGLTTLCRTTSYGYLYIAPAHIPPVVYILCSVSNVFTIASIFTWNYLEPEFALIFDILNMCSLSVLLYFSCYQLNGSSAILQEEDLEKDIWITRVVLHNGVAGYGAWTMVATILNVTAAIRNCGSLEYTTSDTIGLAVTLIIIICWFCTDTCLLDSYFRYIPTPYIIVALIMSGSINHHWDPHKNNCILVACVLATAMLLTIIKLAVLVRRHRTRPFVYGEIASSFNQSHKSYNSMSRSYDKMPESIVSGQQ